MEKNTEIFNNPLLLFVFCASVIFTIIFVIACNYFFFSRVIPAALRVLDSKSRLRNIVDLRDPESASSIANESTVRPSFASIGTQTSKDTGLSSEPLISQTFHENYGDFKGPQHLERTKLLREEQAGRFRQVSVYDRQFIFNAATSPFSVTIPEIHELECMGRGKAFESQVVTPKKTGRKRDAEAPSTPVRNHNVHGDDNGGLIPDMPPYSTAKGKGRAELIRAPTRNDDDVRTSIRDSLPWLTDKDLDSLNGLLSSKFQRQYHDTSSCPTSSFYSLSTSQALQGEHTCTTQRCSMDADGQNGTDGKQSSRTSQNTDEEIF